MTASTDSSVSTARRRPGNRGTPAGTRSVRWVTPAARGLDRGAVRGSRDRRARCRAHLPAARVAAGALLALAALLALPAHAQTETAVWTATLTVGQWDTNPTYVGYASWAAGSSLSDNGFSLSGDDYTVFQLYTRTDLDTVYIAFVNPVATRSNDFTGATLRIGSHTLSFGDGTAVHLLYTWTGVSAVSDAFVNGEDLTVSITAPVPPTMSVGAGRGGEADGEVVFPVSLDKIYHKDATANWSTSDGTATAPSDYVAVTGGALTIAAGDTSANITVSVNNDNVDEPAETFTVSLSDASLATLSATAATAMAMITDDDPSTVTITAVTTSVEEGQTAAFAVARGITDNADLVVTLGNMQEGNFISATVPTSLTIHSGATSSTLSIATVDDEVIEGDGSVTVTIQANSGYTIGTASATVNIRDNDASYLLDLAGGGTVSEAAGTVPFTVTLSESSPTEAITVQWAPADGSATASADYTAGGGTLNFAAGESGAALTQGFTVTVNNDSVHEADEQFTVVLSNATGTGASIGAREVTVTIDDDEVPALSIGNASANEGAGSIGFPVTLSLTSEVQITVGYETAAGTATAADDFTAADGTLTFAPGARSRTISVDLANDAADEDDETFTVTLKEPAAGGTGSSTPSLPSPASAQGTIVDDDGAPQLSIADAGAAEGAGEIHFEVSLDAVSTKDVSASWSTSDGTATAGSDYTAVTAGTLAITSGTTSATLTVTVTQDTDDEPSETFTVTLDNPVNGELAEASATGTIEDDDPSVVTIAAVSTSVTEGSPAAFVVSRGIADDMDLAVTLGGSKDDDFVTASLPPRRPFPTARVPRRCRSRRWMTGLPKTTAR